MLEPSNTDNESISEETKRNPLEAINIADLKTILMILGGNNLNESHIAPRIISFLESLFGATQDLDSPQAITDVTKKAIDAILEQYPDLGAAYAEDTSFTLTEPISTADKMDGHH